jgi:hypothetical protein
MVLKSPAEPLGSPADGVIPGVARVNGDSGALPGPDVGASTQSPRTASDVSNTSVRPRAGCLRQKT